MKKALSLIVLLSTSFSTSSSAQNAMQDLRDYTQYLEKALVLNDQASVNAYATALGELVWKANVTAAKGPQAYQGTQLGKQVKAAKYGFRRTKANKQEAAEIYRAIDTLAVVNSFEIEGSPLWNMMSFLVPSTPHQRLFKARYEATKKAIAAKRYYSALLALAYSAGTDAGTLLYADSTYIGKVYVTDVNSLQGFRPTDFYPAHEWIQGFYVKSQADQQALASTGVTTNLIKVSQPPRSSGVSSASFASPPPVFGAPSSSSSSIPMTFSFSNSNASSAPGSSSPPTGNVPTAPGNVPAAPLSQPPKINFGGGNNAGVSPDRGGLLNSINAGGFKLKKTGRLEQEAQENKLGATRSGGGGGGPVAKPKPTGGNPLLAGLAGAAAARATSKSGSSAAPLPRSVAPAIPLDQNDAAIDQQDWAELVSNVTFPKEKFREELKKYLKNRDGGQEKQGMQEKTYFNRFQEQLKTYRYNPSNDSIVKNTGK